jgi:hypothetical protein
MAGFQKNLLVRLHKWAIQKENFLTEAFAHLLVHLLEREPDVAAKIICEITGGYNRFGFTQQ